MRRPLRVAIVGGGIAGLTASIALEKVGIRTTIFERRQRVASGGGGFWLYPHAIQALQRLGLADAVIRRGTIARRSLLLNFAGDLLWKTPLDVMARRWSRPPLLLIGRNTLVSVLGEAIREDRLHLGARCIGYVDSADGIHPEFAMQNQPPGGPDQPFDGLIGADGFHSAIRRQVVGPERLLPGSRAWGGRVEVHAIHWPFTPGDAAIYLGRGRILTLATLAPDAATPQGCRSVFFYWFDPVQNTEQFDWNSDVLARGPDPLRRAHAHSSHGVVAFTVRDRHPLKTWGRGRVSLVGDAAHPSRPDAAQGVGQALQGMVTLSQAMARYREPSRAFRAYEAQHRPWSAAVTRYSRILAVLSWLPLPDGARRLGRGLGIAVTSSGYRLMFGEGYVESADRQLLP